LSAPVTDLAQLNARRLRAVQLRVDGLSLTRIRGETGLSVPTIIKACQAFEEGGWAAIDVGVRGRPRGAGRLITAEQEAELRHAALHQSPAAVGCDAGLWDAAAVQGLAQRRFGVALEARAVSRMLERWGLALKPLPQAAGQAGAALAWVAAEWPELQAQAKLSGARLLWVGALRHADLARGAALLVGLSPRGSLVWLPVAKLATEQTYIDFFAHLLHGNADHWLLALHGPDLSRATALTQWLAGQPRLSLRPCAVAPVARREPESLPVAQPGDDSPTSPATAPAANVPSMPLRPLFIPTPTDHPMSLTHLQRLEAESIHIMREVVAEADNPVMLYSIGKDSAVMLHLAKKAFFPSPPPFPLLHVDTTWKFRAMYEMRDRMAKETGMDLLVHHNPEAMELGINPFTHGSQIHTDMWKTQGLKQALDKYGFDVAFGGARRDEEKSRAKERIFSFRSAQHRWDPKNQRPELWRLYNGRKMKGESIRCFPISNWTELDIWQYIHLENVPIVPLYFAAERPVVDRDGTLIMVDDERFPLREGEVPMMKKVRFRTLGCYPLSGAVESEAETLTDIIQEMLLTKTSERQGRMIDHDAAASMEKKKQEGYF
jgi:sulfate adenylyltransferase subunit 2